MTGRIEGSPSMLPDWVPPRDELRELDELRRRVALLEEHVLLLGEQVRLLQKMPDSCPATLPALQVVPPDPDWIPILHRMERTDPTFPRPCGQVGLYLTRPPQQHRNASLEEMRVLVPGEDRWRPPTRLDVPLCSSCGVFIDPFSNADLDYLSQMLPSTPSASPPPAQQEVYAPTAVPWSPPHVGAPTATPRFPMRARRARRKPEVESPPPAESPGSDRSNLPPAFPAHTQLARDADDETIEYLTELAGGLGIPR